MTQTKTIEDRREVAVAREMFSGDRIQAIPLGAGAEIASIRSGASSMQNLHWMLQINREHLGRNHELASVNRFDRRQQEHRKLLSERLAKAYDPNFANTTAAAEFAAYREFELTNDVIALPFALGAFQAINLSADELPLIIRPKARQYFNVRYIGQDGGARQDQWRQTKTASQLDMSYLSTDRIEYPLVDLMQGNVEEYDLVQSQIRFDMEMKIDDLALTSINAAKTVSGLRSLLNLHALIDPLNIPDTNYLDLTSTTYGPVNTWTLPRLKQLLLHLNRFGQGVDADGGMSLSSIQYSPQNLQDWWDFVDIVTGFNSGAIADNPQNVLPPGGRQQVFTQGVLNSAWGNTWSSQVNARISKGRMYAFTNQPLGWFFTKTELDRLIKWEGPDQQDQNYGEVLWRRALNFAVPDLWKHHIVIIDF